MAFVTDVALAGHGLLKEDAAILTGREHTRDYGVALVETGRVIVHGIAEIISVLKHTGEVDTLEYFLVHRVRFYGAWFMVNGPCSEKR